jgi:prolipoprotein diacylglyceryltransferase
MPKMMAVALNFWSRGLSLLKDHPVLHRGRSLTLVGFGIFAALDATACTFICCYYLYLKGVPVDWPLVALAPLGCLMTLCGAKVFHWIALGNKFFANPRKYLGETGYYEHGGILGAICWILLASALLGVPRLLLADAFCWGALLGQFFGRLGCFNYGCCFGKQTSLPVGVCYTNRDSKILRWRPDLHNVPVHPTQLYAAGANLSMFFIVGSLLSWPFPDGTIACGFLAWHGLTRLAIEHFREDIRFREGRNRITCYVAVAMIVAALGLAAAGLLMFPPPGTLLVYSLSLRSMADLMAAHPQLWGDLAVAALVTFLAYGIHGPILGRFPGRLSSAKHPDLRIDTPRPSSWAAASHAKRSHLAVVSGGEKDTP